MLCAAGQSSGPRLLWRQQQLTGRFQLDKQKTAVRVAGREYTLVSADDPAHIRRVAQYADRKIMEAKASMRLSSNQAPVLAAINLADELIKAQDENSRLRREIAALREALNTKA